MEIAKMTRENFSIGAFYNITKNQDNPIKTVGRDSFLSAKTPKNTKKKFAMTDVLQFLQRAQCNASHCKRCIS